MRMTCRWRPVVASQVRIVPSKADVNAVAPSGDDRGAPEPELVRRGLDQLPGRARVPDADQVVLPGGSGQRGRRE